MGWIWWIVTTTSSYYVFLPTIATLPLYLCSNIQGFLVFLVILRYLLKPFTFFVQNRPPDAWPVSRQRWRPEIFGPSNSGGGRITLDSEKKIERFGCSFGTFENNLQENLYNLSWEKEHLYTYPVGPSWITSPSPCHLLQQAETLRWLARSASWSNDAGFALKSLNGRSLEVPWPPHDESLVKFRGMDGKEFQENPFWHTKSKGSLAQDTQEMEVWLWDGSDDFCWPFSYW